MKSLYLGFAAAAALIAFVPSATAQEMIACPALAKLCPDGSSVSPTGPHCEFPACPGESGGGGNTGGGAWGNPGTGGGGAPICNMPATICPDGTTVLCAPCPQSGGNAPGSAPGSPPMEK